MNVLIIHEDSAKDRHVTQPIVEKLLAMHGKGTARVSVLRKRKPHGKKQAMDPGTLRDIVTSHKQYQLFLLIVDRDGDDNCAHALRDRERELHRDVGAGKCFIAECAHQELEVWALATVGDDRDWTIGELRSDNNPKGRLYYPYVVRRGIEGKVGEGRQILGQEAARNIKALLARCPEVRNLEKRIADFIRNREPSGEPYRGS